MQLLNSETGLVLTTSDLVQGHSIRDYVGIVAGEALLGTGAISDFSAKVTDFFGGRIVNYENTFYEARGTAIKEMCDRAKQMACNAIIGVDIDLAVFMDGYMLVTATGTAVRLKKKN